MLTATAGFRHDSIATARQVLAGLAATSGEFTVMATEDLSTINAANLAMFDVVFFALTSGELALTDVQKSALLDFVSRGGGFMGAHSATDTLYGWPEYGQLVGAYFKEHPWTESATVIVEDQSHPSTAALGSSFSLVEEFYTFRENPRPAVQVLLRLDEASVGASGDFPLAWVRPYGNGRSYYNALGHFASTWSDPRFQQQLIGAIRWTGQ
jgi:type 1 glutamine amidotransferase